jgi:low temperature requirement protein LtrA
LFIIIALGESLLVTGASFAQAEWTGPVVAAFATAFVSSVAMWWIYFDIGAERGSRRIAESANPGRLARLAYTYLHIPIIAGIIVTAVGDELEIAHPTEGLSGAELATVAGGPALYLLGHVGFRLRMAGTLSRKRLAAALACCVAGAVGLVLSALATATLVFGVLVVLIVAERIAGIRRQRRGEPSPLERLEASARVEARS